MNTGIAVATESERAITEREAWQAVEEFGIGLTEPRVAGGRWLAGCVVDGKRVLEFGDSAISAVEEALRKIGGVNG